MEDTKELVNEIQDELQNLSSAITEVVNSIYKITEPLAESQKKVPEAALQLAKINVQTEEATNRMIDKTESIVRVSDDIIADLKYLAGSIPPDYARQYPVLIRTVDAIENKVRQNMDDAEVIQNALQFQDITSQQLLHASTLVDEIEQKLNHLLNVFSIDKMPESLFSLAPEKVYDPNADNRLDRATQEGVDSLVEELKGKLRK